MRNIGDLEKLQRPERLLALAGAVAMCAGLAGCSGSGPHASSVTTTTRACTAVTPTKDCSRGQQDTSGGFLTNTVWEHKQR